jgi:serine/threonine protein kinase
LKQLFEGMEPMAAERKKRKLSERTRAAHEGEPAKKAKSETENPNAEAQRAQEEAKRAQEKARKALAQMEREEKDYKEDYGRLLSVPWHSEHDTFPLYYRFWAHLGKENEIFMFGKNCLTTIDEGKEECKIEIHDLLGEGAYGGAFTGKMRCSKTGATGPSFEDVDCVVKLIPILKGIKFNRQRLQELGLKYTTQQEEAEFQYFFVMETTSAQLAGELELGPKVYHYWTCQTVTPHSSAGVIVMEHLKGVETLDKVIYKLSSEDKLLYVKQVIPRLHKWHSHGWLHHDTHSGNFLVNIQTKKIWLIDYGIATKEDKSSKRTLQDWIGTSQGKPVLNVLQVLKQYELLPNDAYLTEEELKTDLSRVLNCFGLLEEEEPSKKDDPWALELSFRAAAKPPSTRSQVLVNEEEEATKLVLALKHQRSWFSPFPSDRILLSFFTNPETGQANPKWTIPRKAQRAGTLAALKQLSNGFPNPLYLL